MNRRVMDIELLHEFLGAKLRTKKVSVREENQTVIIEPFESENDEYRCPLRGIAKGSSLDIDKFLKMKKADKELEDANDLHP